MQESKVDMSKRLFPYVSGTLMSINFIIFWAIPVGGMGSAYKFIFKPVLKPMYDAIDQNKTLRKFAVDNIYTRAEHADFFAMSLLLCINCFFTIGTVFYWQLSTGSLPWWLIAAYYCSWVGIGGSMMGTAYGMAHKEVGFHFIFYVLLSSFLS